MRHNSRKARSNGLLTRLEWVRAHTKLIGEIFRDLKPLILALVILLVGHVFDADAALNQLVPLLAP